MRRRLVRRLTLPVVLAGLCAAALCSDLLTAAEVNLNAPLPVDPAVRMAKLGNGLDVWIRAHQVPPGRVGIWLHVDSGSINEEGDERGLAHFLEHMAFRGSENFPPGELTRYFESIGLTFGRHQNAFTAFDQTTYTLTLPDTEEYTLRKGLLCMADFAFRLSLLREETDKERGVILEEARARKGPHQRMLEKLLPVLLPGSRVAERLPIGKEEVIERAADEDLRGYYKTWYRPDNSALLIVGDVDPEAVQELAEDAFRDWRPAPNPAENADAGIKPYSGTRAAVLTDPELTTATVKAVSIRPLEKLVTVGDLRRKLLDDVGIWMMNRRLSDMVRNGTAPFQEASLSKSLFLDLMTYIDLEAECQPDKWAPSLLSALSEVRRARKYGFLDQEFEDAKTATLSAAERAARTEPTRDQRYFLRNMNDCVAQERKPVSAGQSLELIRTLLKTITLQEVWDGFRRNFGAEARLILLMMPEVEGGGAPSGQELLAVEKLAEEAEVAPLTAKKRVESLLEEEPVPGRAVEREEDPDLGILSVTLSNGVRAHLRSMDYKKGQVLVRIALAGGAIKESSDNRGVTSAAALVLTQPASQKLTSIQIRDFMTGKKVKVGGAVTPDALVVHITGSPEDLEHGFRLAHLLLTAPRLEASALKVWKEQMAQEIERRRTDVEAHLSEEAKALLSGGDLRLKFPTQQQVAALTLQQAQEWIEGIVRSAPIEASIVGDMDRGRALELTLKYLGSLPERPRVDPALRPLREVQLNPGPLLSTVNVETITPRAMVLLGWRGADWTDVRDRRVLQIAARVLQVRLREEIREKRGLTYSPFCYTQAAAAYPGTGRFVALFAADPDTADETMELTRDIMEAFARGGPTEDEMAVVHKQFANIIETQQKEPSYWSSVLADLDYHGTKLEDVKKAREKYTSYTREDVLEVLGRYVKEEARIQVIVLPKPAPAAPDGNG